MQDRGWSWREEISQRGQYVSHRLALHAAYAAAPSDFQYLCHTFASHAVMNGVPVPVVSRLLGHSDVRMPLRYAHLADKEIEAAAERIGTALARVMSGGQ